MFAKISIADFKPAVTTNHEAYHKNLVYYLYAEVALLLGFENLLLSIVSQNDNCNCFIRLVL